MAEPATGSDSWIYRRSNPQGPSLQVNYRPSPFLCLASSGTTGRKRFKREESHLGRCDVDVTEAVSKIRICGGEVPISINYLFNEDVGRPVTRRLPSFNSFEISLRYNSIE